MKKLYFILSFILVAWMADAENLKPVAQKINDKKTQRETFVPELLFRVTNATLLRGTQLSGTVSNATVMEFSKGDAQAVLDSRPENILFIIPTNAGTNMELELYKSNIFTSDFSVVSSKGQTVPYTGGIHYWGIIKGDNSSLAAISIFNDEVMGMISSSAGNLILGKLKNDPAGDHILYREHDLNALPGAHCFTPDNNETYKLKDLQNPAKMAVNCIRLYWEVNYDIYQDKGSILNATNYVTGLFNESAIIYSNDAIPVGLSQVFVWDIPSPYTSTSSSGLLNQFQAYRNSFNGDLGHLLGYGGGGGVAAGFNGLCASNLDNSQCYSGISSSYSNVPVYSWSVEVVTHEQGHLMGSRHTHACVWNGNNTAIDGCGPSAGYPYEGACSGAPLPPTGGTIMSYCHLVSAGINFSNGFGPQPAAVILNNYNNAACLTSCSGLSCFAPVSTSTAAVTSTTATFNWTAVTGATSYNIQYRIIGTSTWSTGTSPVNSYNAAGLTPGSNYEWQVQTVCPGGTSVYTNSINFTTIPLTCNVPANTNTINITSFSATFSWNAVPGAASYSIQYRVVGTPAWSTGTSLTASYSASGLTPNTNYEWQVMALCVGGGTSAFSSSVTFTTLAIGQVVTLVIQPDSACGKDAFVWRADAAGFYNTTTNYGKSQTLLTHSWTTNGLFDGGRLLVQFDLNAIPVGALVLSAELSMYNDSTTTSFNGAHSNLTGSNASYLQRITDPWNEFETTWSTQPGTTTMNQVSLPATTNPHQHFTNINVLALVNDMIANPTTSFGFMLTLQTETPYRALVLASSDHPDATRHPKLVITYANPAGNVICHNLRLDAGCGKDAFAWRADDPGYNNSNLNFGMSSSLLVHGWTSNGFTDITRTLLDWDLSFIPSNATIVSADLSLYNDPNSASFNGEHQNLTGQNNSFIQRITQSWEEYGVTWNTQPVTTPQNQLAVPASVSNHQDFLNLNVTALMQDIISNPGSNYGLMMQLANESPYRDLVFASSENHTAARQPRLQICYNYATGINNTDAPGNFVSVFPNPGNGIFTINFSKQDDYTIRVFEASGKMIQQTEAWGAALQLDLTAFAKGVYTLVIVSDKAVHIKKIIIS